MGSLLSRLPEGHKKTAAEQLLAQIWAGMSVDAKVARLIDRLVLPDRDQVQAAVTALDMLGQSAAPSIIRRIDDRRAMPVGVVAFENRSPDAFEAINRQDSSPGQLPCYHQAA